MVFTDEQQKVIDHNGGHLLVRACAGAGKTQVMVARTVRLIRQGCDPSEILIIQFNRAAKLGFETRLRQSLGSVPCPPVRTFNAMGFSMLKRLNQVGSIPPRNLTPPEKLAYRALQSEWRKAKGNDVWPTKQDQTDFMSFITLVKAGITSAGDTFQEYKYSNEYTPFIHAFYHQEQLRKDARHHSFDDQIWDPIMYLQAQPEMWSLFADRYEHILVDEFQDTNSANIELVAGIAGTRAKIAVVGDDAQTIYGYRGSSAKYILREFERRYPQTTVLNLTRNFRYGHQTSLMANHLIMQNTERSDNLTIPMPSNTNTQVMILTSQANGKSGITDYLKPFHQSTSLTECAMLVRFYSASIPYEIELIAANIPFFVYGRAPLMHLPEIACLYAAICLALNQWDEDEPIIVGRYMNALVTYPNIYLPEHVNGQMTEALIAHTQSNQKKYGDVIRSFGHSLRDTHPVISKQLKERAEVIDIIGSEAFKHRPVTDILSAWITLIKLDQKVKSGADEQQAQERLSNILAFRDLSKSFSNAKEMIDALGTNAAAKAADPPDVDHLKILSVHRSKGLEFKYTLLPGWTKGGFPRSGEDIEEARRLAYVAITRAIHELVFLIPTDPNLDIHCKQLDKVDHLTQGVQIASPFLYEAEPGLSKQLANAINNNQVLSWNVRDPSIVERYVNILGLKDRLKFTESADNQWQKKTRPLPVNQRLKAGQHIWHRDHGLCEVLKFMYEPVYLIKPASEMPERLEVLSERQGWRLLAKST